ncbi:MAG: cation:proton antiporter [Myxococcales bacterium]|nr:cation:proton antiporter [Myxococcales bacterium]
MSGSSRNEPLDIVLKAVIVVVLIGAMLALHRFAVPGEGFDPRGLLALGFVILATYTIGELAEEIGLPHITGYLLAGVVMGPSVAEFLHEALPGVSLPSPLDEGILSHDIVGQLSLLNDLALALIALTAGGELKLDGLRRGIAQITGILTGQALLVPLAAVGALWGITQLLPETVPSLSALSPSAILALGAIMASLAFATSPAATIAVINSTGSKGPMAQTVLSTVVLKDVLVVTAFSAAMATAVGLLGTGEPVSLLQSFGEIGTSIVLGVALGGVIHLYLRFIGAELLMFTVAMVYTATFLVEELHGEPALMFIVAGIVVGNFSHLGETLIHEVERLSLPVYVVFFTLAGANLHLDLVIAMGIPALILVSVRVVAIFVGTRVGASLTGAEPTVRAYAWLGFVSQAGVVIALATKVRDTLDGPVGQTMFSLILAGVAINEVVGPVLLQVGLGLAGEVQGHEPKADDDAPHRDSPAAPPTPPPSDQLWGAPLPSGHDGLDRAVEELGEDLRALARDQTWMPLSELEHDTENWLRRLRRELLRITRRACTRPGTPEELAAALRADVGELSERWRDAVLDRSARASRRDGWSPLDLTHAVDEHVATLPERFEASVHADVLAARPEPRGRRLRRWLLRVRNRLLRVEREVPFRQLALYHFSGEVPSRLEGLAALLVNAELRLANRVGAMFEIVASGFERAAVAASEGEGAMVAAIEGLRGELDVEFASSIAEATALGSEGNTRVAQVLGGALQRLRVDVQTYGTPDLSPRMRRYSRVFDDRNDGLTKLGPGLRRARGAVQSRYAHLALELEIAGMQGWVHEVVHTHAERLSRILRGRGPVQLRRAATDLGQWLHATDALLETPPAAGALAQTLRTSSEPVAHRITEAHEVARGLATELSQQRWIDALVDALRDRAQGLTDRYDLPDGRPVVGEWALPPALPTSEFPFSDVVIGFVESSATRQLLDVAENLLGQVRGTAEALDELERILAFNVELAAAELEVLDPATGVPTQTQNLVEAMVVGAVGRAHEKLEAQAAAVDDAIEGSEVEVHRAVLDGVAEIRRSVLDGAHAELTAQWAREAAVPGRIARRARRWRGLLPDTSDRLQRGLARALGEDRLLAVRTALGLPERGDERDLRSVLAPETSAVTVPLMYRRLFSPHALEAGDLLSGHSIEVDRVREALAPRQGYRSVALVGIDPQASLALMAAATRGSLSKREPIRWTPERPVTAAQVQSWFDELPPDGRVVVLNGLRWLFRRRPDGFAPLERLVELLVADGGHHAFVLVADQAVWAYCTRVSGIEQAVGTTVRLQRLDPVQLEQALLARHAMSGLGVVFEADDDLGWQLQHVLLRDEDVERRRRNAWFRTLHDASAGVLQDALRLWMAAIRKVDPQRSVIHIGAVPRPPLTRLAQLPEQDLLTLVEASRQGWIDVEQHTQLFRTTESFSRAHLAQLRHVGLLTPAHSDDDEDAMPELLMVAPHLRGPLHRVLTRRRWT